MGYLEHDVRGPEAGRPNPERAEVERYMLSSRFGPYEGDKRCQGWQRKLVWDGSVGKELVKVLKGVVCKHRPSLEAFDGAESTRRWRAAFQRNHPLKDWEKA